MRRPPFTVRPLALSVTLALTSPVVMAADATTINTTQPTTYGNVQLTAADNAININNGNTTTVTGVVSADASSTQLIKQGTGILSLTNNNTYAGGTDVQAGTLSVARAASLGDGAVTLQTGSTLETQSSTTLTQNILLKGDATISTGGIKPAENITQVTSTISGDGGLIKSGAGTLSLTADNAYKGNTTISEGTLAISRSGSLGSGSEIKIENAATLKTNQNVTISQNIVIDSGDIAKIDTGGKNSVLQGQIKDGTLEKTGDGSLTLNNTNNTQQETVLDGGLLIIKDNAIGDKNSLGAGQITIKSGTLQTASDMALTNNIITSGSAGGSINTDGHQVDLIGQITGNGRLVKTGGGTLTLTNTNNYDIGTALNTDGKNVAIIGNTVINGGVLAIDNDKQLGKQAEKLEEVISEAKDQYSWKLGNVQIDGGALKTESSVDSDRYLVIGNAGATIDVSGAANTTTLSGLVDGKGALIKEGDGVLKLTLDLKNYQKEKDVTADGFTKNTLASVSVNAGVLEVDNTAKDLGGAVAVNLSGGELRINQGTGADLGVVTLKGTGGTIDTTGATITTGEITGSGGLKKQGSGTLVLTGLNNQKFTGDTTISEGKVQINSAQGLGDANTGTLVLDGGSLQVVGNTEVTLNKNAVITSNNGTVDNVSSDVTLSGVVSGAGQLVKSGAGKFSLTNEKNSFEGGVRIKDGTLEVSTDGSLGKANTQVLIDGATLAIAKDANLSRQIVLTEKGGAVSVAGTNTATLSGTLSLDAGVLSADFTKSGTGTLNLTKDNTNFKGNTIIQEGTLGITGKDNLAQGQLFLDGGNLRTNASLNFDKEIIINSTGGIDTSLDDLGNKTEVTVTSKIQGNGGLVKTGEGTLTLSADNAYAGGTQVKGGTLVVNQDSNLGLQATDITLNGGTLQLGAADAVSFKKGDAASRLLNVGQEGGGLDIGAFDLTIETDISGDGTLTQTGTAKKDANGDIVKDQYGQTVFTHDGTLTLKGNNTVSGITVESGTLKIDANQNLGTDAAQLTLKDGTTLDTTAANAKLDLEHGITVGDGINGATLRQDEDLSIRGLTGTDKATLRVDKGAKTLAFNGDSSAFAGNLLVQGNIEVKQNLGTGNVEFNQGVESNAPDSNLHITGDATFDNQFKLNGQTTINADKDTKSVFNKAVKDADYNTDPGNDLTVQYRTGSLVKTGAGEISLNAENLYSGNTDIQQGTVTAANNKALGTGNVKLQNGTTLQSGADVTLANKVELVSGNVTLSTPQINPLTTPQNTSLTLTDTVSGAASLTKTGAGSLILNGTNTYAGETIIKEGKVAINNAAALGVNTNVELNANAALSVNVVLEANQQPSTITLNKNIALKGANGSQVTLSATGANVVLDGMLSNDANTVGIIKEGTGTLELSGTNTNYKGKTTIKEGNLAISEAKNLGGKVLVELAGGGLTLLNDITIGGGASTDAIDITGARGAINTAKDTSSTLELAFKGQGLFVKEGEGQLTLSGTNTEFSGGVSIDKGTLTITKDDSLGKKDTNVILNGGTLQTDGVTTLNRDVQLNQDSTIKNIGASTVGLNRLQGNYAVTLEGGGFNLKAKIDETTDPDTVVNVNQHNGTILKNTNVIIGNDADLGKSTGKLNFAGGATLDIQGVQGQVVQDESDAIRNISMRNMGVEGTGNVLDVNEFNVTLGTLNSTLGKQTTEANTGITKQGTGNLILNKDNKDYKGTLTISEGAVFVSKDNALGVGKAVFETVKLTTLAATNSTNNIGLNGALSIDGQTFDNTLNGVISGTGSLVKDGAGQLNLTGANSYAGGTQVNAGKVALDANTALGVGSATFAKDTELSLGISKGVSVANAIEVKGEVDIHSGSFNSSLTGVISGSGSLVKDGAGQLNLTGANSYAGGTQVTAGKVALDANTALGTGAATFAKDTELSLGITKGLSVANAVQVDGAVKVHSGSFDSSLDGVVSGKGSLVKDGTGTLTLKGSNSYEGGTIVNEGTLAISQNANLGKAETGVTVSNATLLLNGDIAIERKVTLAGTAATIDTTGDSSIDDAVSGSAKLIKTGDGTLTLSTANTYAGGTQIAKGTLEISSDASLGAKASKFGVDVVIDDAATLALTGNVAAARKLNLTGTTATIETTKEGSSSSLSEVISGSAKLVKEGAGSLTLSGVNTYAGGTDIDEGTLVISQDGNLGKAGTGVVIGNEATLALNGNVNVDRTLALAGTTATVNTVTGSSSLVKEVSGSATLVKTGAGTLTLNSANSYAGDTHIEGGTLAINNDNKLGAGTAVTIKDATLALTESVALSRTLDVTGIATVDTAKDSNSSLDKAVNGSGQLVKTGTGTLELTQANSYSGGTAIKEGNVTLAANAALGTGAATFAKDTELSLGISKGVLVANDVQVDGEVDIHSGIFDSSLTGVISGTGSLVKDGAGLLSLTGANSYAGGTQVTAGKVALDANTALGVGSATFAKDTELSLGISKGISVANAITTDGIIKQSNDFDSSLTGVISGTGSLVKDGAGQLNLTGANSYAGGTQVTAGKVALDANTALGVGSATFAKDTELSLGISKGVLVANDVQVDGEVDIHSGSFDSSLTGVISGTGSLVKDGAGQLNLTGANSYAGGTQVNAGKVALDANTALGVGSATFAKDTELSLGISKGVSVANAIEVKGEVDIHSGSFNSSLTGVISGSGSLVKDGAGQLNLTGANSYAGGTQVTAGKVALDANTALGTGAATFAKDTELSLGITKGLSVANAVQVDGAVKVHSGSFDSSLDGVVSGKGSLVKDGTGTLTLKGSNSYEGGTIVNEGTLAISQNANLGKAETGVTVSNATLLLNGDIAIERKVTLAGTAATIDTTGDSSIDDAVSGSAKLIKTGDGTLTLSTANTYAGGTQIAKGTLEISSDASLGAKASKFGVDVVIDDAATLALTGNVAAARKLNLTGTTATIETTKEGSSSSLSEVISGSAKLVKEGAGSLSLTGTNSYEGGTVVNGGTVTISSDANLGKAGTDVAINNATLAVTANATVARKLALTGATATINTATDTTSSITDIISGTGQLVKTGAGSLSLTGTNSYEGGTVVNGGTVTISSDANLGKAGTDVAINNATLAVTANATVARKLALTGATATINTATDTTSSITDIISGTGQLVKTGAGSLSLTGTNSYEGGTVVNGGTVTISSDANLGKAGTDVAINNATLAVTANATVARKLALTGATATINTATDTTSSITDIISGTGQLVKTGAGSLSLTGTNSYEGGTVVNGGTVTISSDANLGKAGTDVAINNATLAVTANATVARKLALTGATATINTATDTTSSITDIISGTGQLVKTGAGSLSLTGTNSYEGGTVVNGGTVTISSDANLGKAGTDVAINNATLAVTANATVARKLALTGATATINTATDTTSSITDIISGTGQLVKTGAGSLSLTGTNSYEGGTVVNGGTVTISSDANLGKAGTDVAINNATLAVTANATVARKLALTGATATINTATDTTSSITDIISGTGQLVKTGAGSLSLTGTNSYEGGTVVNGGTVTISSDANLGKAGTDVAINNATLAVTANATVARKLALTGATATINTATDTTSSITDIISGTGQLVKTGAGSLSLTGTNSYEGGTVVNGGTVTISSDANLGKAGTDVAINNATLAVTANATVARKLALTGATATINTATDTTSSITDIISGTGQLVKTGAGSLSLTGTNSYEGGTVVNGGTVTISSDANLGKAGTDVAINNATLAVTANATVARKLALTGATATINTATDTTSSITDIISGTGQLVKTGAGSLSLTGTNSYEGGTVVNGGTVTISSDANLGKAGTDVAINNATLAVTANATVARKLALTGATATINTATDTTSSITDIISGTGQLVKTGAGSLSLTGTNSYEGGTVVNGGTVTISSDANLGKAGTDVAINNATLAVTANATVARKLALTGATATINTATDTTSSITDIISGTGQLVKTGAGSLSLTGTNSYEGGTVVNGGTVTISSDANLGKAGTDVAINNATLAVTANATVARKLALTGATATINTATDTTSSITDIISGTGQLVKTGAGSLSLTGTNSYEGGTVVNGGTVTISSDANLGKAGTDVAINNATLAVTANATVARKLALTGATATINTATDTTSSITDIISGTGQLVKTGAGSLSLTGTNSYEGGTVVNGGTVTISSDANLGKAGTDVAINNATLAVTANATVARKLALTGATATINTATDTTSSITDIISGTGQLVKTGAGSLSLTGTNSYEGGTVVNGGTVTISSDANLGKAGTDVAINNATLAVTANATVARKLALTGATATINTATDTTSSITDIISGTGQLVKTGAGSLSLTGTNSYEGGTVVNGGTVTISSDANLGKAGTDVAINNATLAVTANATVARKLALTGATATINTATDTTSSITDIISGTGQLVKTGAGSLSLTGTNSYEGGTVVNGGTVTISSDANLGKAGTDVAINNATLAVTANATVARKLALTGATATINTATDTTSSITDIISGTGQLVKTGAGSLSLTGTNSYEGGTVVNGGTVTISSDANLGKAGTDVAINNATLAVTANATVARKLALTGATATINTATDTTSSITDIISGTGQLVKTGAGSLSLTGTNSYEGGTVVNGGTVTISSDANLGKAGTDVAINNATLAVTANATVARKLALTGATATINTATDTTSSITDIISGTGQLVKTGAGSLSLTGTNSYEGGTVVNGGTVTISSDANLGKAGTDVAINNATLAVTANATVARKLALTGATATINTATDTTSSITDIISGTGQLVKTGAGSLSLTGTNSYEGGTVVNGGTVTISSDANLGKAGTDVAINNATLAVTANATVARKLALTGATATINTATDTTSSITDIISGTGQLVKTGAGSLSLTGTNSYEGGTVVNGGTVTISSDANLGKAGTDVAINNATLAVTDTVVLTHSVSVANTATIDIANFNSSLMSAVSGLGTLNKAGTGTLSLNGTNTFVGSLNVQSGKVAINNANSLGANSNSVSLANNTSLSTTAAVTAQQSVAIAKDAKVTLDTMANDSTLSGVISGTDVAISKAGTGTLSLNGTNTFVGSLAVTEGKVAINNANSLGANSNSVSLANNTSLSTTAAVTAQQAVAATGNVTIDTMANDSTLSGVVSGNAAISKAGTGKLTLAGANTVVGDITVNAGSLALANAQALGATSNKVVLNQAALIAAINNLTVNNQIEINKSATIDTGVNTLNINSAISGGTLSKTGSGTLVLTGTNTQNATVVNQGKLQVANNSALGATDANVTLNGATFESSGTQTYARNFVLGNTGGVFNTLQSTTVTLSNTVSGDGALTKTGTGTLVLAGANAYKGSTNVSAGKLVVSQANNLGQTTNINLGTATLETKADMSLQNVVLSGVGTILTDNKLTIAGVVSGAGGLVKQGSGSLELSSENTYSGGTTLEAGTLTLANGKSIGTGNLVVKSGQVVLKDGFVSTQALIQNAESSSDITGKGTFSNAEVNSGMLTINGDITTTTNTTIKNNSTLFVNGSLSSLNTIIDNGTLFINGSLTSPITVGSRAKLAGRGTITGNVAVNGLLSPGNSPAILTINGDVDQKEGSSLLVEIDGATAGSGAGHHDQVVSSGNYNIAASNTVLEAKLRGITGDATNSFVPSIGQSFDVVKAKAVNGAFATYKQPTEGLAAGTRLDIGYTANSIRLYVTPVTYTSVASGENATGAAKFLDNVLVLKDTDIEVAQIYNAILPANSQQLQAAMINMSPALYAESAQSVLALQQKLHNSQTISETFKQGGLALRGFQQDTDVDSDGNGLAATRSISGVQLSVDSEPYANDWQMGAAVSIVNKADVESNSSALKLSGHDVALTVRKKVSDWMLGATVDMGNYTFDTNRNINIVGTQFKTNQQDVKTSSYGVGVQASRNYGSWTLATGLRYNNVKQDGFVEQGNSLLALKVADVEQDQVVAMLGGAWQNTWKTQMWNIVPRLSLDLEQVVAGDTAKAKAMLGAGQVTATASDAGKTLFRAGLGVNFVNKDGITIGVDASTEQADNLSANTGRLTFSKSF